MRDTFKERFLPNRREVAFDRYASAVLDYLGADPRHEALLDAVHNLIRRVSIDPSAPGAIVLEGDTARRLRSTEFGYNIPLPVSIVCWLDGEVVRVSCVKLG